MLMENGSASGLSFQDFKLAAAVLLCLWYDFHSNVYFPAAAAVLLGLWLLLVFFIDVSIGWVESGPLEESCSISFPAPCHQDGQQQHKAQLFFKLGAAEYMQ